MRAGQRPTIAFFEHADVFEDFYPHYGVGQQAFATTWADTGSHAFVSLIQRDIADVTWYSLSISPQLQEARHRVAGFRVRIVRSSVLHRALWHAFYRPPWAWRWRRAYPWFALLASYAAPLSLPLLRALRKLRPRALFLQDYASGKFDVFLLLALTLGIPLVAYHAGSAPEHYLGKALRRVTLRHARWLLVSSERERDMLIREFRVDPARTRVLLTPIDTIALQPVDRGEALATARLVPSRRYLLFMGRLEDRVKRVGALIRAFASVAGDLHDVDLLICGQGPDLHVLEQMAGALAPGRVVFPGWVSDVGRKVALYGAAEYLVLTSVSEGFPTVVGEAMACGTPVIATDVGGVSELVREGETGFLLDPEGLTNLRATLLRALAARETAAAMRSAARARALARVAPDVVARQLRECLLGEGGTND